MLPGSKGNEGFYRKAGMIIRRLLPDNRVKISVYMRHGGAFIGLVANIRRFFFCLVYSSN